MHSHEEERGLQEKGPFVLVFGVECLESRDNIRQGETKLIGEILAVHLTPSPPVLLHCVTVQLGRCVFSTCSRPGVGSVSSMEALVLVHCVVTVAGRVDTGSQDKMELRTGLMMHNVTTREAVDGW